jgi:hypothetical protein
MILPTMWSLKQYRRFHKHAEAQFNRNPPKDGQIPVEGKTDGSAEKPKPSDLHHSHQDDKIYVKAAGDDDPIDPRNWPLLDRCKNIAILAFLIFVQAWAGAAESMANSTASIAMGVSKEIESLSTAMYLFGIGAGALVAGPISETVGRNPTYLVSTFCYMFFVLGAALAPTFGGRIVCRFFIGLFASPTLSINGASVRDQFRPVKRAFVFPIIAWANVAGKRLLHGNPFSFGQG